MNELSPIRLEEAAATPPAPHPLPPGFHELPIDWLWVDPENMRQVNAGADAHKALVSSILTHGVLQPLVVRWLPGDATTEDCYVVLAGRRRLSAALDASLATVPCMVRALGDEQSELAVELAENIVRADMSAVDVWMGVERLAKAGADEVAIAVQFNLTLKRVKQLRAMGAMHPSITTYIRDTGSFPNPSDVRVICQAPQAQQAEAFKDAAKQAGKNNPVDWWRVSRGCVVTSIPFTRARFERAEYKGAVVSDLFADAQTEEAADPALFLQLQERWLAGELTRWSRLGFEVALAEGDERGEIKRPANCEGNWVPTSGKLPAKKDRGLLCYVAKVMANGAIEERIYKLKQTAAAKAKEKKAEAGKAVSAGAEGAAVPQSAQTLVTSKGADAIELAKRNAVGGSLMLDNYATDMLAVALLMLSVRCSTHQDAAASLLAADGSLDVTSDNRDRPIMALAHAMLPAILRSGIGVSAHVPMGLVERIGAGYGTQPTIGLDRDGLDFLKKDGLSLVMRARRMGRNATQKQDKQALVNNQSVDGQVILGVDDLPLLVCDPAARLPHGWGRPYQVAEEDEIERPDDDHAGEDVDGN